MILPRTALLLGILWLAACQPSDDPVAQSAAAGVDSAQEGGSLIVSDAVSQGSQQRFTVLTGGTAVGGLEVTDTEDGYAIFYEYRNNGRGPTFRERVSLDAAGFPTAWQIEGATTFGNPVAESFELADQFARWQDSTGESAGAVSGPAFYVPQNASPYSLGITARALLAQPELAAAALPAGELRLELLETLSVADAQGRSRDVQAYALSGSSLHPSYFLMDGEAFFGSISPRMAVLAAGFEGEEERLRARAADYITQRFEALQQRLARVYEQPVRIRNVRLFDPATQSLGDLVSVVSQGQHIVAVEAADATGTSDEVQIDGEGGTLVPGMFEMHAHAGQEGALLNLAAGVTSMRDMGNNNAVLARFIEAVQSGRMGGPRVYRSAFIEGRSPFNSNNGIVVESEAEAVAAVADYAASGGFHQIKIYNSMKPEWVPAVIAEARRHGMRVSGHIPAFTNADAMIAAGYDEITHINQLVLGWLLGPEEDTRTLLRLTALQRLPELDLESESVQLTIGKMVQRGVAIDPTLAIHERLLLARNGEVSAGAVDYVDHLPVAEQRAARSAMSSIATPEEDAAYRGAWDQLIRVVTILRERGIFLVPGTDLGGSFTFHRELELYQQVGMAPAEILAWATQGMADYLGVGADLGSIAPGKLADFFLIPGDPVADLKAIKTIRMVVADGRIYFPEELYPEFGIRPFVPAPRVY